MVTPAGLRVTTRFPVTTVVFRLTVPEKAFALVTLRVEVPEEPALIMMELGFADRTKSGAVPVVTTAV